MKKIFKKNQLIITALALMIAAAGYLSYTNSSIGKDELAQTSADLTDESYDIVSEDVDAGGEIYAQIDDEASIDDTKKEEKKTKDKKTKETSSSDITMADAAATDDAAAKDDEAGTIENPGETVMTSSNVSNVNFAVEAKLNREQVRSQNKENLMAVINSSSLSDAEKQSAVDKMVKMTDIAQRESDAEMLLEAKGFTDVVVSVTEDEAEVVLDMGDVTDAKRAQVEDIVKRKTKVPAENIVITPITSEK